MKINNKSIGKTTFSVLKWILEHLFCPAVLAFLVVLLNSNIQAKKRPHLDAREVNRYVKKESQDKYRVECHFIIENKGGSPTEDQRLAISIDLKNVVIAEIEIEDEYDSYYDKLDHSGVGYNKVKYLINLPEKKSIEGKIAFNTKSKQTEKGSPLLKFSK